jgi:hypothetical protein
MNISYETNELQVAEPSLKVDTYRGDQNIRYLNRITMMSSGM